MDENTPYFVDTLIVGDLEMNCYLFGSVATHEAVIIDPGADADFIMEAVRERKAVVKAIILTHGHFDHIGALEEVRKEYACPVMIHRDDADALTNPMINLSALTGEPIDCAAAERILNGGDRIDVGDVTLEVIHTPGHTRGGICLKCGSVLFAGDVLFNSGIGRTDLPGGSHHQLERSIMDKLYTLPDDTLVLPGHGEATTVGYEKQTNPYVRP
jgi:glyoxylase-like metal-dependent hydrolase (beta-lactamase superfamily II)